MLNYIWLGLIILGLSAALVLDVNDFSSNTYQNGNAVPVSVVLPHKGKLNAGKYDVKVTIAGTELKKYYRAQSDSALTMDCQLAMKESGDQGSVYISNVSDFPPLLKKIASVSGKEDDLTGTLTFTSSDTTEIRQAAITFESVSFIKLRDVVNAAFSYASKAVEIALGLIGIMALWLGIMKIAEQAGIVTYISKAVRPITRFLFPDIPSDHPAVGSIIMNLSANFLGLSNAATPFGLKAMEELDTLNKEKGTATNAMCTFLAINTAGMTLIPATAIALRASAGSTAPAIIIGTSLFGSTCATITGIISAKLLENFPLKGKSFLTLLKEKAHLFFWFFGFLAILLILMFSGIFQSASNNGNSGVWIKQVIEIISTVAIPFIIFLFLVIGVIKKVKIYEQFVEGAKEGFNIAIRIIPYLVAMLVAIGIFRAGGAMEWLISLLRYVTDPIGMPAEALPMALMRPLSGSGSLGVMAEIMKVHGPDSFIGILTSTFYGSSETTFYVLAVYFGSVNVKRTRHALAAGLLADLAGALGALFIVKKLFT